MTTRNLLLVLVLFVAGIYAFAQNATTSVRGTVTDPSGATVAGAQVTLTDVTTQVSRTQETGKDGGYNFVQLHPSTYSISVTAPGFGKQDKQAQLLVDQASTINFTLAIGQATVTVDVSASAQTLNVTDATMGNSVNNSQIQAMPIDSRNVADLLSLQPGVLYLKNPTNSNDDRTGAVAGSRSDQGNVTLDGIDDNDQTFGYAFTGVLRSTLDSTEEYRVTTTNSNADAGRSSGAQVTLVSKSGTNKLHGSVYEYFRNAAFDANDWFLKKSQLDSGLPNKPGKLTRNTFGGTIGGPIKKDKLFFFFNYEGQRTNEDAIVTRTVPTAQYKAGIIRYQDANGGITSITPSQLATLDAPCTGNGVCPWGPGVNPNVLASLAQLPTSNGFSVGDGLNTGGYTFSSPSPTTLNTSILKLDWNASAAHHIFVRGNLQKDVSNFAEQFPGQPASHLLEDNTKGIAAGDTWIIGTNLINDLRYGYTRQGFSDRGVGNNSYVDFRFLSAPTAENLTSIRNVPVNSIVDNLSWTKGHTYHSGGRHMAIDS